MNSERWPVTIVTAYGRGETLALALQDEGFDVQVLDFSAALGAEWTQGAGPFPIASTSFLPAQSKLLAEVRPLARGLTFWLADGPLEMSGPLVDFFASQSKAVQILRKGNSADFDEDWLRRFMRIWASPFEKESWQSKLPPLTFPYADKIGFIPAAKEERVMSFERYQALGHKYLEAAILRDAQFEGARLTEIEVESGRREAYRADQWIWCLSSEESDRIGVEVSQLLFARGIRRPEWRFVRFQGRCDHGSWSSGFPEFSVVIEDICLPWSHANMMLMRWIDRDLFHLWMKLPAWGALSSERQAEWAEEARLRLSSRLPQAAWVVDADSAAVCPNSPVYEKSIAEESLPTWKNWDWIAPESLSRLDLSARLEREAQCFHRLLQWRSEKIKKQGARSDHALHAP